MQAEQSHSPGFALNMSASDGSAEVEDAVAAAVEAEAFGGCASEAPEAVVAPQLQSAKSSMSSAWPCRIAFICEFAPSLVNVPAFKSFATLTNLL